MENQQIELLQKLTWAEKFDLIQMLWSDIAAENEKLIIPENHKEILRQRLELITNGDAKFRKWEEIRSKYTKE